MSNNHPCTGCPARQFCQCVSFNVIPALSAGQESKFDRNSVDMLVILNGRSGTNVLQTRPSAQPDTSVSDYLPTHEEDARGYLLYVGYSSNNRRRMRARVACGLFSLALDKARLVGATRLAVVLERAQFVEGLREVAAVLACRALHAEVTEPIEVQVICRLEDANDIKAGLEEPGAPRCQRCYTPGREESA